MPPYLPVEDEEQEDLERGNANRGLPLGPTRSIYALTRPEITKNLANRFVHSRSYVFLYLGMAALSATTVGLSLAEGCPGVAFYVLEWIINGAMIIEVGIRFVAFGRQFWKSPFNTIDLGLTCLCVVTLLVITFSDCGATSKEEELFDTLLLVARNVLQFGRLAAVMRKSGQSIFARPKPIDLNAVAQRTGRMDIDLEEEDELDGGFGGGAAGNPWFSSQSGTRPRGVATGRGGSHTSGEREVLFDATGIREEENAWDED